MSTFATSIMSQEEARSFQESLITQGFVFSGLPWYIKATNGEETYFLAGTNTEDGPMVEVSHVSYFK